MNRLEAAVIGCLPFFDLIVHKSNARILGSGDGQMVHMGFFLDIPPVLTEQPTRTMCANVP